MRHLNHCCLRCLAFTATSVAISAITWADKPWIIDTHTHFKGDSQVAYEKTVREFEPANTLGMVVLPEDYAPIARRLAIRSTVVVEAVDQDKSEYNDWLFEQTKSDLICGYVARCDLSSSDFLKHHNRYLRTGMLKGYRFRFDELKGYLDDDVARKRLALLQQQGLVVDLLIDPKHIEDVERLAREYSGLTVVINHCFRARMTDGKPPQRWYDAIARASKFDNVYCKFSSLIDFSGIKPFGRPAPRELAVYLPVFQTCFDAFGEDRLIFGTNWGVSTHFGSVDEVVRLAIEFLGQQSDTALMKVMRKNAIRVYRLDQSDVD